MPILQCKFLNFSILTFANFTAFSFFLYLITSRTIQLWTVVIRILPGTTNSTIITTAFNTASWSMRRSVQYWYVVDLAANYLEKNVEFP